MGALREFIQDIMGSILRPLDAALEDLLKDWNSTSTILAVALITIVAWVIFEAQDADTHPLLLARQSQPSYVRQPGESAIYRSPEVPHGYPLKTGLSVKPPGAPAYSPGKDGDIRDIWRRVVGEIPLVSPQAAFFGAGKQPQPVESKKGKILTVYGKEEIEDHDLDALSQEINVIGKTIQNHGVKRVAVYLPNSVELLLTIFAGAYYNFTVILIPYNQPHPELINFLNTTKADALIAAAGALPLADVTNGAPSIKEIIWTVEKTSRHMDWNEVPEGIGGKVDVSVWHELVQDQKASSTSFPADDKAPGGKIVSIWQDTITKRSSIVEFTQQNIVSAVGAAISALPSPQRLNPSDLFLPADSLTHSYTLVQTLAALFNHATVAINSVAGPGAVIGLAARSIAPTVIVASAESALEAHATTSGGATGALKKLAHSAQSRTLASGRLPAKDTFLTRINAPARAAIGTTPGKLRLLFISERAGAGSPPLTANDLSDLRIYTGARVAYALTASKVAGAVAQTNIYDYRRDVADPKDKNKHSHFGIPLSSVEVKVVDSGEHRTTDERSVGEIVVTGPAVAGGEARLGVAGTWADDGTLAYV